jgi:hypothetical protein
MIPQIVMVYGRNRAGALVRDIRPVPRKLRAGGAAAGWHWPRRSDYHTQPSNVA